MKKIYVAPQTEAIQLLGESAIMAASGAGTGTGFTMQYGTSGTGGSPR